MIGWFTGMSDTLQPVVVQPRLHDVRHSWFLPLADAPQPWVACEVESALPPLQPASSKITGRVPVRRAAARGRETSAWGFIRRIKASKRWLGLRDLREVRGIQDDVETGVQRKAFPLVR